MVPPPLPLPELRRGGELGCESEEVMTQYSTQQQQQQIIEGGTSKIYLMTGCKALRKI